MEELNKKIPVKINFTEEKVNEEFLKCTVDIMSCDQVANGTKFIKEGVERAKGGLNYAPVIGVFKDGDFGDHGIEYRVTRDEFEEVVNTVPFGVVISDTARWEDRVADNGEEEEYLVADCYLWKRYAEAVNRVKDNKCNQSMEVTVKNGGYNFEEDFYEVKDFNFGALCILGEDVTPAFNLAKIRTSNQYSEDKENKEYNELMSAFRAYCKIGEEGGDDMDENKKIEEPKNAPVEEPQEEPNNKIEDENDESKIINEPTEAGNEEEPEEDKFAELENKYNDLLVKFDAVIKENEELKVSLEDLKEKFSAVEVENESLKQFKKEVEDKAHMDEVDKALEKYAELESYEEYRNLIKDKYNADLDELIRNIKIFCFDNNIVLNKKEKKNNSKQFSCTPLDSNSNGKQPAKDDGGWGFMNKYLGQ